MRPVTSACALIVRQSAKRGTLSLFVIFSMKAALSIGATSVGSAATAVALRGEPSIRAISPNMPFGPTVSSTVPNVMMLTRPDRTTYIEPPSSSCTTSRCATTAPFTS